MSRILLVRPGGSADEVDALSAHEVLVFSSSDVSKFRTLLDQEPEVVLIDLSRQPSQGRDIAAWIRRRKVTRRLPIVFLSGQPDKVKDAKELLPDAVYCDWKAVNKAIGDAIASPPSTPVVPEAMAGYSGTPLPRKLGIRDGFRVVLVDAPDDFEKTLGPLPEAVTTSRTARGRAEVVILFVLSENALGRRFGLGDRLLKEGGRLWIAWPKKASGVKTDITQNTVRQYGLDRGYVDYKIAAIDAIWSGLCFARRTTKKD